MHRGRAPARGWCLRPAGSAVCRRGGHGDAAGVAVVGRGGVVTVGAGRHLRDPRGLGGRGVEGHLVGLLDRLLQPHRAGLLVLDVDHLAELGGRLRVAGLLGQLDGPSELGGGQLFVTGCLGRQALLDRLRQLGLAGVVGDLLVDPRRQLGVVGPLGLDQPLGLDLVAEGQLDPGGELLLPDRLGRQPDGDVVVAGLVSPGARGVGAGQLVDGRTTVGEVLDRRRDLADEQDLRALRRPHAQLGVGDAARHGAAASSPRTRPPSAPRSG